MSNNSAQDAPDGLPSVAHMVRDYGLNANKKLGQHFLFDFNLMRRIARAAGPLDSHVIVEIGPGPGGLTRALLMEGAMHVIAIEKDERAIPLLKTIAKAYPNRLTIIHDDALKIDIPALLQGRPARICANLPYNVGTELLIRWLSIAPWPQNVWYDRMILMFQKEVAQRICAQVDDNHYGRLAIFAQLLCECHHVFDVNPAAFTPPPKVWSAVVDLRPLQTPPPCPTKALQQVTAAAFGQRRKMLRASLKAVFDNPTDVLNNCDIPPEARAETRPISDFVKLANQLSDV